MTTQHFRVSYLLGDPGWYCDGCGATFAEGVVRHKRNCGALASIADAAAQERIRQLKRQVDEQRRVLERKNRELDALHYVWCDGACERGIHRWSDALITRELVETAERNTRRLRRWYRGVEFRLRLPGAGGWQKKRWERTAAKTDLLDLTPGNPAAQEEP